MTVTFFIFAGLFFIIGLLLFNERLNYQARNMPCKKGHKWQEIPVEGDEDYVYLRCQNCNRTLGEIFKD